MLLLKTFDTKLQSMTSSSYFELQVNVHLKKNVKLNLNQANVYLHCNKSIKKTHYLWSFVYYTWLACKSITFERKKN